MVAATSRVPTLQASKYINQLCKHWSHKLDVSLSKDVGIVRFPAAVATLRASQDTLVVTVEAGDGASLERMKDVIASHLDRFAFREAPLSFEWSSGG